jgi:hypothetical protein
MELSPIANTSPEVAKEVQAVFQDVARGKPVPEILDKVVAP